MGEYKNYNGVEWRRGEDGEIDYRGKTLESYHKLCDTSVDMNALGFFFAFSEEQFDEGVRSLVERGLFHPDKGEKLVRVKDVGAFGTRDAWDAFHAACEERDEQIRKECSPQEVYFYEYNNHECMYGWDGDEPAWNIVISIFGEDRCKKEVRRVR